MTSDMKTCTRCGIKASTNERGFDYKCPECKIQMRRKTCSLCGSRRWNKHESLCSMCVRAGKTREVELSNGEWVRDGLIWRWQPNATESESESSGCGTIAGYSRHRRKHEAVCDCCREAHRVNMRRFRERKNAA